MTDDQVDPGVDILARWHIERWDQLSETVRAELRPGYVDLLHRLDEQRVGKARGMTVDGGVLADSVADAVPRLLTDDAARQIAEDALRCCHHAGMTILRGKNSEPWTPPEPAEAGT